MRSSNTHVLSSEFLYSPTELGRHCHCSVLLAAANGDLFVTWYSYPEDEYVDAVIVLTRKLQGESDWEDARPCFPRSSYSAGNSVLFETSSGRIGMFYVRLTGNYWTDSVVHLTFSDDRGETWDSSEQVWPEPGMMVRHPPITMSDGSLLLPTTNDCTILFYYVPDRLIRIGSRYSDSRIP
jgi:hypothetical protein